jgi:hypothetical protein
VTLPDARVLLLGGWQNSKPPDPSHNNPTYQIYDPQQQTISQAVRVQMLVR